jgi:hypothetical protein
LRRTFAIDVLARPGYGSRLRLFATITDGGVIRRILLHLGLPAEIPEPAPARQPAWWMVVGGRGGADSERMRPSRRLPAAAFPHPRLRIARPLAPAELTPPLGARAGGAATG